MLRIVCGNKGLGEEIHCCGVLHCIVLYCIDNELVYRSVVLGGGGRGAKRSSNTKR